MTTAEIIQIVIGILSLVATIAVSFLIYWLQTRHEKEIQKLQAEKELEMKARLFLIDNEPERDYLPWCVIVANLHPLERHSRKIYTAYCRCTEELQNEILRQAGYKSNSIQGTRWVQKCIMDLEKDIERYNLGRDYLYDGAKYFHRSYERYRDLRWNGTPSVFEPINKDNKSRRTFNINQLSVGEYVDEYFYYYIEKKMEFDEGTPIPPMDYVWSSQNLACRIYPPGVGWLDHAVGVLIYRLPDWNGWRC